MKLFLLKLVGFLFICSTLFSQSVSINKVEPPNWWTGMKTNEIQLMLYGENLKNIDAKFSSDKINISKIHFLENSDYLFLDVSIPANLAPDTYILTLSKNGEEAKIDFPILKRESSVNRNQGFNNNDVIYLITPDRFANGDYSNDTVKGMINDFEPGGRISRHGGDIQGIIDHLDYLKDLGITAIWPNPLIENKCDISYHGYSATDFYNIDARFGTNELYKKFVAEAHKRELKVILDHVTNHISTNHAWIKNLPMPSWINGSVENHKSAMHHKMIYTDVNGDSSTIKAVSEGWFTDYMADLNQKNPYLAKWIIQNTIWWLEYAGIDGIREDTYPYADQLFLSNWAKAVRNEYPNIKILAEVWTGEPAFAAPYQSGSKIGKDYDSYAQSVTDFGLRDVFAEYLEGKSGLYKIYSILAKDYLYPEPNELVTFIDNHDVSRMMLISDENVDKVKTALTILLTTRGIPSLLYATEIGMTGGHDHGYLRGDFPGGFSKNERNAFTKEGRTDKENEIFNFIKTLLKIRKENAVLREGQLIHFPPKHNMYVYFRKLGDKLIMIAANEGEDENKIDITNYGTLIPADSRFKDLRSGNIYNNAKIESGKTEIFEIVR